jgi:hypothetical protein
MAGGCASSGWTVGDPSITGPKHFDVRLDSDLIINGIANPLLVAKGIARLSAPTPVKAAIESGLARHRPDGKVGRRGSCGASFSIPAFLAYCLTTCPRAVVAYQRRPLGTSTQPWRCLNPHGSRPTVRPSPPSLLHDGGRSRCAPSSPEPKWARSLLPRSNRNRHEAPI